MAVQLKALIAGRNKALEQKIIEAVRSEALARSGGRAHARELDFAVADMKEAVNARMRIYNLAKKLDFDVTVKLAAE